MKDPKRKACGECPFRRASLQGYVGSDTPERFVAVSLSALTPMPCHMEIDYEQEDWETQLPHVHQCTGHAIFLSNTAKRSDNPEVKKLPANREEFFSNAIEFLVYHGRMAQNKAVDVLRRVIFQVRFGQEAPEDEGTPVKPKKRVARKKGQAHG